MCLHGNWGYTKHGTGCVVKDNVKAAEILAVRWPSAAAAPDGTAPPQRNYNKDCSNMGDNSSGGETGTPISASGVEKMFIEAMTTFGVTDKTERRMLWAQCAHETGGFKNMTELPSAHASSRDPYKGRGIIQLTGQANYREVGKFLKVDLVKDPGWITRTAENNVKATLTWWTKPTLGARCRTPAMRGDVDLTSVGINVNPFGITQSNISKVNGLEDRRKWWAKAQTMDI
jgi:putative chitinase